VFADFVVPFWNRMVSHAEEIGIGRTVDAARIGEGFGEIGLRESKEFVFVKFLWFVSWHRLALPASVPQ
jgi:hypothetical protein